MTETYLCGIDHVQLAMPAGREDEARAFYGGVLGLSEAPKPPNLAKRGGVWFEGPALRLHLGVETPFQPAKKAHPAFCVRDLNAFVARLAAHGVEAHADEPLPGYSRVYVADPFGNRIELLERTADSRVADEGRAMTPKMRAFAPEDEAAVIALWERCGLVRPWNDPRKDIRRKLALKPEWFLVGELEGEIVASCMLGYDGHRGWIYYLAVSPDRQRSGLGRELMAHAERLLRAAGCPKINLQVRTSNLGVIEFYKRVGFSMDEVVSLGKRLEVDEPR